MTKATAVTSVRVSPTDQTPATVKIRLPKPGKVCLGDMVKSW